MKGLGGNMGHRSFRVRSVLLGFLLAGGTIGLVAVWYVSVEYVLLVTLIGAGLWGAASLVAFSLYESRRKLRQRARLWTVPAKESRPVDNTPESLDRTPWSITPLSVPTMSIPRVIRRILSADSRSNDDDDDALGEPQITGEELDAMVEVAKSRHRYASWLDRMGLANSEEVRTYWHRVVDTKDDSHDDAP